MSLLLSCQSLSKAFGPRALFAGISFEIMAGERLALIGPNGSGKSTLLRVMAGLLEPDDGICSRRKGLRIGYLPQEDQFAVDATVESTLAGALATCQLDDRERQVRLAKTLSRFAFADPHAPADTLSGGWRKRLALARELIQEPELLLLDEPTNHLDLEGILWLEKFLAEAPFAFVLASHDRYLLEHAAEKVVEINRAFPQGFFRAAGAYSEFLEKRADFLTAQARQQENLANQVRREVEWLRRGPKARTSKSQARIDRAHQMMSDLGELKQRNSQGRSVEIDFTATGRTANKLLVAEDLAMGYGARTLFSGLSFSLAPGDCLGLLGVNGSGKTTLLKLLTGELQPQQGAIERARRLQVVWFDQKREQLDRQQTLRRALCPEGDTVQYRGDSVHVTAWAKRFLFGTEQLDSPVGKLSGGEQARILIANLMLKPADLLLLDEPTNDLDIPSLEVLEESLEGFPGAIVLITHDRAMLDRLSTFVLGLDGQGGGHIYAEYSQWLEHAPPEPQQQPTAKAARAAAPAPAAPRPGKLSYQEQREYDQIQTRIAEAEQQKNEIEARVAELAAGQDYKALTAASQALTEAGATVDALYHRWDELERKLNPG